MIYFCNVIDFPINVGNRPLHGPPANIPITFELAVLLAGGSSFFGFFTLARLPQPYHPVFESEDFARAAVDAFFLSVELPPGGDADKAFADVQSRGRAVGRAGRRSPSDDARARTSSPLVSALSLLLGLAAVALRREHPRSDGRPPAEVDPLQGERLLRRRPVDARRRPRGPCRASGSRSNPRLTTGREPDGPMQPNGEPLPNYVATVPLPVSRKLLELGRKRFDITCATCHGPLGDGKSIVARADGAAPAAVAAAEVRRPSRPATSIEVITKGFGMMASYAAELTVEERWAVVAYLRALQLSQTHAGRRAAARRSAAAGGDAREHGRRRRPRAPAPTEHEEKR